MGNQVKVGVIGLGNIGSSHARAIYENKISGMMLVAVCDTDSARLDWARETFPPVTRFSDHQSMLESGIDAVIIATPHYSHCEIAIHAFQKGLHVLCEKPAGVYTSQVIEMNKAAKQAGTVFSLMYNQRTAGIFLKIREMVQNGELGAPMRLNWIVTNWYRTQDYYNSSSWRASWSGEGGGVLMNQAVHNIDLWQWIFGMPDNITAFCNFGKYHEIEVEDEAVIYAAYTSGRTATFISSTGEYPGTNRLEINGEKGKLVAEDGVLTFCKANDLKTSCEKIKIPCGDSLNSHCKIIQNFADAILKNEALIAPGEEGINALSIINAAYFSSWSSSAVPLDFDRESYRLALQKKVEASKSQHLESLKEEKQGFYNSRWNVKW